MCTQKPPHNYAQEVYDKYRNVIEEYMVSKVVPEVNTEDADELLLRQLVKIWENYQLMLRFLSNMFSYLDRYFVPKMSVPALREIGISCFRERFYPRTRVVVKNTVIKLIDRERKGEEIDRALLKSAVNILVENGMDFYKNDFEVPMLEDAGTYYSGKAAFWISEDSCPDYLLKAEECLKDEMDRVTHYLHSSSEHNLLERVRNELLSFYRTQLVENEHSGCHVLLRNDKKEDLSRMYRLFCEIPEVLESVAKIYGDYVNEQGKQLFEGANDAINNDTVQGRYIIDILQEHAFMEKLLELHDKSMDYVLNVFQNKVCFQNALKEAFKGICSKKLAGITSAEFFATFFDNVLRTGDIGNTVERAGYLLHYVDDRNTFLEFSIKKLADRLLFHKCSNVDIEKTFLSKMKSLELTDDSFTSKVDEMLGDFNIAADDQARFKEYIDTNSNVEIGMDLTVTGLSGELWPSYKPSQLNPPSEMVRSIQLFQEFYPNLYRSRNLKWMYSLGTCNVMVYFEQKPIELTVSTYQAAVIMLFNHSERFSYEEIKSRLNLEDEEIALVLRSLASENYKILLKEPIIETIAPTDKFQLNLKFTDRSNKIKIPFQRRPEEKEAKKEVITDDERILAIKAAMARVMMNRRVLTRQQLLSETTEELAPYLQRFPNLKDFQPSLQIMETAIRELIDEDHLLEEGEGSELKYLEKQSS